MTEDFSGDLRDAITGCVLICGDSERTASYGNSEIISDG